MTLWTERLIRPALIKVARAISGRFIEALFFEKDDLNYGPLQLFQFNTSEQVGQASSW